MVTKNQYQCKINSKWMWGLENAEISITTPKGGTATVNKWNFGKCTSEQAELVWKIHSHSKESNSIILTREEIELFAAAATASKGRIVQATKPKSYTQRKFELRKESQKSGIRAGICGCGGSLKRRDYGKWVGYFCPKCQCGGSYNK